MSIGLYLGGVGWRSRVWRNRSIFMKGAGPFASRVFEEGISTLGLETLHGTSSRTRSTDSLAPSCTS